MAGKCSNLDCVAPISCHEGKANISDCEFWTAQTSTKTTNLPTPKSNSKKLPWTGEPFTIEELPQIAVRNIPLVIGLVGRSNAGKTTYLAMLFTLLLRGGGLSKFHFGGSKTILGWDKLYHKLKVQRKSVSFPDPTPAQYLRLLHLALRDESGKLKDILISDASGEVFSFWSKKRDDVNAENARWIYSNANGFLLFIDCVDLIERKNLAKSEVIDLAQMLKHDLKNRPIIVVWSKADRMDEIHPTIKKSLVDELSSLLHPYESVEISNFSIEDPDKLVHDNNLLVLDKVLEDIIKTSLINVSIKEKFPSNDFFLNYNYEK